MRGGGAQVEWMRGEEVIKRDELNGRLNNSPQQSSLDGDICVVRTVNAVGRVT